MSVLLVVVPVLLFCAVAWAASPVPRHRARAESVSLAGDLYAPDDELAVYHRYLLRVRRHRRAGGLVGVLVSLVVSARVQAPFGFSYGTGTPAVDALLLGLAGAVLGALAAETYRLAEPKQPRRAASLAPRPALPGRRRVLAARLLTGSALTVALVVAVVERDSAPLVATVAGAAVVGLTELTRRAIVHRRRPVLTDRAAHVDGRLREVSASSMAYLEVAAGLLTLLWAVPEAPASAPGWFSAVAWVLTFAASVTVFVLIYRAGPRAPRAVRKAVADGFRGTVTP